MYLVYDGTFVNVVIGLFLFKLYSGKTSHVVLVVPVLHVIVNKMAIPFTDDEPVTDELIRELKSEES